MTDQFSPPAYPVVQFIVARGKSFAYALAFLVLLGCVAGGVSLNQLWLIPAGFAGSAVLLVLLLSYVEVLRIIADTLLPKY